MHVAAEPMAKKGPISIEGSSPEADDFRFRSGGLQGPLFREVQLLETAIAKYGRSGFLRRRLEADELLVRDRIVLFVGWDVSVSKHALLPSGPTIDTPTSFHNTHADQCQTCLSPPSSLPPSTPRPRQTSFLGLPE